MKLNALKFKTLTALVMFLLAFSMMQAQVNASRQANQYLSEKGEVTFSFQINDVSEIESMTSEMSILNYDPNTRTVYAWANTEQFRRFESSNRTFQVNSEDNEATGIVMSNELSRSERRGPYPLTFPLTAYPTYADYALQMQEFAINHPDICELVDIGGTTEGTGGGNKRLLFLKLSDNISTDEAEPKVMYTSSMHGDEITGYPIMLDLIDYFITAYKNTGHSDHLRIKNLIDNSEVWINPMANPDGTYYNNASNTSVANARRANANNVDLNRNYPDNVAGPHDDGYPYQIETQHFMSLAANTHFVLSANFHGGKEVINYPWDNTSDRHPDDDWFMQVSREYATNAQTNSPSGYMTYLNNGITHGADWYQVYGGRQDYMNFSHQCKEVTVEISNIKTAPANQLVNHWNYNREALIEYLIQGTFGFQGKVKDVVSGDPIEATIKLVGHDALGSHTVSSLPHGDFYRPVFAGTYNILIEAPCYNSLTLSNETIANYQTKSLGDILLTPLTATAPSSLSTSGTNTISTNASWSAATADSFDIRYRTLSAPTWTEVLGVTNPYQITGLTPNTTYEFQVKSYCGSNSTAYSSSQQFTTTSPIPCIGSAVSSFPYTETFDGGLGLWSQGLNDIPGVNYEDWTLNAGSTISTETGPTDDFTGGGNYLYTEASDANASTNIGQGVTVTLISPCIDLTAYENANFSFYYHMVGATMGTISVEVSLDNGIIWNQLNAAGNTVTNTPILIGQQQTNQGSPWLKQAINLSNYDGQVIKLRFSGTTGSTWSSDMAIDQVQVSADLASSSAPPTAVCQNITVQLDNTGNATIIATDVDGGSTDDVAITDYDIDINSFDCSDIGTPVNVTLTVTDAEGQSDTCNATVTVVDQIDPEFENIPANILLTCGSNQPTWTDPTATDNCDNTLTVTRTDGTGLNSGDLFPNGITTISYSVTDDSGNINTVSFNVNVTVDNQNPDAICKNLTIQLDGSGNATITASQINNGSSDNCGIASISASQTAFTCADVGTNNVTLTVTDANGNSDTCIAVVTVTLQDEPTATNCWDNYVFNTGDCAWENTGTQPTEPTATNCWDNYVFNSGNCTWENQGSQPAEPTATNCWDNYVFNSGNCTWENQGTQPTEPTATNCWDNFVFNSGNCSWENQGTQPAEPTATNCWDNYVFNTGNCTWENQGTQPTEPTATNCWDNYVFNTGNCTWENQGTQPTEPTATNCWDNYVFNSGDCTWENQGSQPTEPTAMNCWDNFVFNTGNCTWENQGSQPTEPTATNCWDNYVFNVGNCTWENQGSQPTEPTATNCWDNFVFNSGNCSWENQGTQPAEPTATNCWDNYVFNTGNCSWQNQGSQPTEPTATNCWDNYVFNSGNCSWENQGTQPTEPTATNCWDNYVFNTGNCTWENQGSQPTEPTATNCWDNYVFNVGNCSWENQGSQPAEPTATNCWDNYVFNSGNCSWENQGSQPTEPTATNCWDNYVFNTGNCTWENQGSQPTEPTATNCWDNYVFNTGDCAWENQGTQPAEPTATNCWDNYVFNSGNCSWENQGSQPAEPTATNCWDNYVFSTGDCAWENQGTQPAEPTATNCWDNYVFNTGNCTWENQGSQPTEPTATNCWDNYVFNTGNCSWQNQGSQPTEPTATNCWDNYVFNSGNCSWENQGSQPTEPTATNCWDNYVFNSGNCSWENQGTQPTEPTTALECWETRSFDDTNCEWIVTGTQPTEPTATNCWDNFVFNTGNCTWENQGSQPAEPTATNCWDNYVFNTGDCTWENQGSQPAEPTATNCWDNYVFNTGNCSWENQGTQPAEPTATNCWDSYVFNTGNCTWENQGSQPAEPTGLECWETATFNTATCVWDVTNDGDTVDPVCNIQNITVELDAFGNATITADQIDNGSTDACDIDTISVTPNTFDSNDIGDNNVVFTVTDNSGNTSNCNAIVTVMESTLSNPKFDYENVSIQPNPFNNYIQISLPTSIANDLFTIQLFDVNGRLVYNQIQSGKQGTLAVQGLDKLQQGPYFIKLINKNNGYSVVKKLIRF